MIPGPFLIEVPNEVAEFDFLQDLRNLLRTSAAGQVTARRSVPMANTDAAANQKLRPSADLDVAA